MRGVWALAGKRPFFFSSNENRNKKALMIYMLPEHRKQQEAKSGYTKAVTIFNPSQVLLYFCKKLQQTCTVTIP